MANTYGRIGGDRWLQFNRNESSKCIRQDCKQANRCQAGNPRLECADRGMPTFPLKPRREDCEPVWYG